MQFNYGRQLGDPAAYAGYKPYSYTVTRPTPRFEIVREPAYSARPFERRETLTDVIFRADKEIPADPLDFSADRAHIQRRQIDVLLEHLAARHVIHHELTSGIQYEEAAIRGRLDDLRSGSAYRGQSGKFEADLLKQMNQLSGERRSEEVACWRDTGRLLAEICDKWADYSDLSRKTRMMNFDF